MELRNIRDGFFELLPNLYQMVGRKPACHVYLLKGRSKNVLIDAGLPSTVDHLDACLAAVGLGRRDVHLIILTHEHVDHVGGATAFFDSSVIAAHALAANKIMLQDEFVLMTRAFDAGTENFRVDIAFDNGMLIDLGDFRLRVLHTPGHCSGCICLYEPDHRLLFTGDTVMAGGASAACSARATSATTSIRYAACRPSRWTPCCPVMVNCRSKPRWISPRR